MTNTRTYAQFDLSAAFNSAERQMFYNALYQGDEVEHLITYMMGNEL